MLLLLPMLLKLPMLLLWLASARVPLRHCSRTRASPHLTFAVRVCLCVCTRAQDRVATTHTIHTRARIGSVTERRECRARIPKMQCTCVPDTDNKNTPDALTPPTSPAAVFVRWPWAEHTRVRVYVRVCLYESCRIIIVNGSGGSPNEFAGVA